MKLRRPTFDVPRGCFAISQKTCVLLVSYFRSEFHFMIAKKKFEKIWNFPWIFSIFRDKFEFFLLRKFFGFLFNFQHHFSHLIPVEPKLNNLAKPWKWLMTLNIEKFYQTWNFCTKTFLFLIPEITHFLARRSTTMHANNLWLIAMIIN